MLHVNKTLKINTLSILTSKTRLTRVSDGAATTTLVGGGGLMAGAVDNGFWYRLCGQCWYWYQSIQY